MPGHAVESPTAASVAPDQPPLVLWLDDAAATDPAVTGAKACHLATAVAMGLPVVPGFAITTSATPDGVLAAGVIPSLRAAWASLSDGGAVALVVRSSSTAEDTSTSSMAGQFTSLLDVRGWDAFVDAVRVVLASAAHPHRATTGSRPMAVLVQRHLEPDCGGVLFGLDPVSGDRRHVIVEAVPGSPDELVSGRATAVHLVLGSHGRLLGGGGRNLGDMLDRSRRRRLVQLARKTAGAFDGPQDVEWAFDAADHLWLLQSRDVTAAGDAALATGPVLGPGPVAETFPDPLHPLEVDLWVDPLRRGVEGALHVTGARSRQRIERSPVVCAVGGRVAVDLELFGIVPSRGAGAKIRHQLRAARRLMSAWRVGRLRAALPALVGDLLTHVDAELADVGDLRDLDDLTLVDLLGLATEELVALHGHEVLAGMLLEESERPSLGSTALGALARCRASGFDDEHAIAHEPVVLALTPPAITDRHGLPDATRAPVPSARSALDDLGCRDALRLRCRWVQELSARAAAELGDRLVASGRLGAADRVRALRRAELHPALLGRLPADLDERIASEPGAPLPMAFRLAPSGAPVAEASGGHVDRDGLPASSGRGTGVVSHAGTFAPGLRPVLVVDILDPRLAAVLPEVSALVSETGSALSHLAILARELHVPAVVGVPDARRRFPDGTTVLVDGDSGEVRRITAEGEP